MSYIHVVGVGNGGGGGGFYGLLKSVHFISSSSSNSLEVRR